MSNPLELDGIDFVEFATNEPMRLHTMFLEFGFSKIASHKTKKIDLYVQGDITFILNYEPGSFAYDFQKLHGSSICSMGWRVKNGEQAYQDALARGARGSEKVDYAELNAIFGIGDSLIYLVEPDANGNYRSFNRFNFIDLENPTMVESKGFYLVDHLTNNVYKGTMDKWATFYKDIFGFEEVRYFDIKGQKTGLTSYALRSPCGKFCIPINEADEAKSQINEYLDEYNGPGIQHLAFLTNDLLASMEGLQGTSIKTLDISPSYYESVFNRVPNVKEDHQKIEDFNILVDGDDDGYLLQIFTKNLVGPIFIELIQRNNHLSFGEGNFQALFDSIERDQMKRGVL